MRVTRQFATQREQIYHENRIENKDPDFLLETLAFHIVVSVKLRYSAVEFTPYLRTSARGFSLFFNEESSRSRRIPQTFPRG